MYLLFICLNLELIYNEKVVMQFLLLLLLLCSDHEQSECDRKKIETRQAKIFVLHKRKRWRRSAQLISAVGFLHIHSIILLHVSEI